RPRPARSYEVLRGTPNDELLGQDDEEKEGDAEKRGDDVGRPQALRRARVVLVEVEDRAAEPVLDRRRQLADDRADDASRGGDLEGREKIWERGRDAQLPEDAPTARRVRVHQLMSPRVGRL